MAGNACIDAAKNMREQIFAAVAEKFGCRPHELECVR